MGLADGLLLMSQSSEWLSVLLVAYLKSIVILAAAALLTNILRDASAWLRHFLWCAALSSLLLLPLFSGGWQPLQVPVLPSVLFSNELATQQPAMVATVELSSQPAITLLPDSESQFGRSSQSNPPLVDEQHSRFSFSWQSIILLAWLIGVLLVLARFLAGIFTVRRLVRRANEPVGASWSELLSELSQRLRLKRPVRLLCSDESIMPMTCGILSPVILLPNEADDWLADRRRVVVLHELIHIKRRDLLSQTLSQVVCALYWFNPLVWRAARQLRTEQEWACDEQVVATGIRRSDYAAHLLEIARRFHADALSATTTTAMARPSQLQERLGVILKPPIKRYRRNRIIAVSVIVMCLVFISTAVTRLVPAQGQNGTDVSNITKDVTREVEQKEKSSPIQELNTRLTSAPATLTPEDEHAFHQNTSPTPPDQPADQTPDSPADPSATLPATNQTKEQVFNNFSDEERDRLSNNGIGPEYIKEMADAGYRQLSVAQLIALFSNAVHADYVAELRSAGYAELSTADLLALKTNGITRDVIRSFQAVKHANFKAKNYIALRSNGVTPSYLASLNDAGYDSLTPKQIVEMYLAGVTSEFIRAARSRGNTNLSPEELIELKRREKQ